MNASSWLRTAPLRFAVVGLLIVACAATAAAPAPAAPAAAAPAARVAVGDEIGYEALADYVGARVRVHTKAGSERDGVMTGFSSIAINLQVDGARGGFLLGVPRETIVRVVLLADVPAKP